MHEALIRITLKFAGHVDAESGFSVPSELPTWYHVRWQPVTVHCFDLSSERAVWLLGTLDSRVPTIKGGQRHIMQDYRAARTAAQQFINMTMELGVSHAVEDAIVLMKIARLVEVTSLHQSYPTRLRLGIKIDRTPYDHVNIDALPKRGGQLLIVLCEPGPLGRPRRHECDARPSRPTACRASNRALVGFD